VGIKSSSGDGDGEEVLPASLHGDEDGGNLPPWGRGWGSNPRRGIPVEILRSVHLSVRSPVGCLRCTRDRTPRWWVKLTVPASDRSLTLRGSFSNIGDRRMWLNRSDTWCASHDRTLGVARPVIPISTSSRCVFSCSEGVTALFRLPLYKRCLAGSSSLSWPFALT
jgi:hypothetical protein